MKVCWLVEVFFNQATHFFTFTYIEMEIVKLRKFREIKITSLAVLTVVLFFNSMHAQTETSSDNSAALVVLREVTISNVPDSFDASFFISKVVKDTSFFLAFHHLRTKNYSFEVVAKSLDKQKVNGEWLGNGTRTNQGKYSKGIIEKETTSGKIKRKRKGEMNMETLRLVEGLFTDDYATQYAYTQLAPDIGITDLGNVEVQKALMKQLIFFPGTALPVPFFGDKCALFSKEMVAFYTYEIYQSVLNDGVYVFEITQKPGVGKNETVFKKMITHFRESDLAVVYREFDMQYNALLFDFSIQMKVDIEENAAQPFPKSVLYTGNWKIPFAKREQVNFEVSHLLKKVD